MTLIPPGFGAAHCECQVIHTEITGGDDLFDPPNHALPLFEIEKLPKMNDSMQFDVHSVKMSPREAVEASQGSSLMFEAPLLE